MQSALSSIKSDDELAEAHRSEKKRLMALTQSYQRDKAVLQQNVAALTQQVATTAAAQSKHPQLSKLNGAEAKLTRQMAAIESLQTFIRSRSDHTDYLPNKSNSYTLDRNRQPIID